MTRENIIAAAGIAGSIVLSCAAAICFYIAAKMS